jgi:hypothetical protein
MLPGINILVIISGFLSVHLDDELPKEMQILYLSLKPQRLVFFDMFQYVY